MPKDTTPTLWPHVEEHGMLDTLWSALFRPRGRGQGPTALEAPLTAGECLRLEGAGRLRLRCLQGDVWATGRFGGDLLLAPGGEAEIDSAGVVISALSPTARLRLSWR
ncbi:hypothetical protein JCM15519_14220 [Fundidesulfovibrio butyratiphilus]